MWEEVLHLTACLFFQKQFERTMTRKQKVFLTRRGEKVTYGRHQCFVSCSWNWFKSFSRWNLSKISYSMCNLRCLLVRSCTRVLVHSFTLAKKPHFELKGWQISRSNGKNGEVNRKRKRASDFFTFACVGRQWLSTTTQLNGECQKRKLYYSRAHCRAKPELKPKNAMLHKHQVLDMLSHVDSDCHHISISIVLISSFKARK